MIMEHKCPHCGSTDIEYRGREEQLDYDSFFAEFDCVCNECDNEFIISEAYTLRSRIIAKDENELERLLEQE